MKQKTIILIGGAPTTGKTTLASSLSDHTGLPWISSDQIRGIMRTIASPEEHSKLVNTKDYTAEQFLSKFSVEEIVNMEIEQGDAVWPGIKRIINSDEWSNGCIIEGINILPHLIAKENNANINPIFLIDENVNRIREVVFNRGLYADANTYSDDVKEKEVEWVLLFNHKLRKETEKYGYSWIEVDKSMNDFEKALDVLGIKKRKEH